MLRTIGYDRAWARAEGAHLYDAEGNRYLDWLGGFGMYNVGRNNPRVRAALVEALELETPGKLALGINPLAGLLAEALLERAPPGSAACCSRAPGPRPSRRRSRSAAPPPAARASSPSNAGSTA